MFNINFGAGAVGAGAASRYGSTKMMRFRLCNTASAVRSRIILVEPWPLREVASALTQTASANISVQDTVDKF
jgi:hypothetical protein